MSKRTVIKGELEIDHQRGVIYFHVEPDEISKRRVVTALRVWDLPRPIPPIRERMLDVRADAEHCDWVGAYTVPDVGMIEAIDRALETDES